MIKRITSALTVLLFVGTACAQATPNRYLTKVDGATVDAIPNTTSAGAGDAGKLVALNPAGLIDPSMLAGVSGALFFGSASATCAGGESVVTVGSTPLTGSITIKLNGVSLDPAKYTISGSSASMISNSFSAGDVVSATWATTNPTPGGISVSISTGGVRSSAVVGSNAGATTTATYAFPSTSQAGDLAVVFFGWAGGTIPTAPTGWTKVGGNTTYSFWGGAAFSKVLTSGDLAPVTINGNISNGSPTVSGLATVVGLAVGMTVAGTNIPTGATITAIDSGSSTMTLSLNATATTSGATLTLPGSVTVYTSPTVWVGAIYVMVGNIAPIEEMVWTSNVAAPAALTTSSAPLAGNILIGFASQLSSTASSSSFDVGSQLGTHTDTTSSASGALWAETLTAGGATTVHALYSPQAGGGFGLFFDFQAILIMSTAPTTPGIVPEIAQSQVIGLPAALAGTVTALTTTGTSGAASLTGHTLNIPNYAGGGGGGGGGAAAFPLTIVQESTAQSTGASITFTFPQALASSGDTAFALIGTDASQTITATSGWTIDINQAQAPYARFMLIHKASAGDTSVSLSAGATATYAVYFFEVSGSHTLDQFSAGGQAMNSTVVMPAITPTAGAAVFAMVASLIDGDIGSPLITSTIDPAWRQIGVQSLLTSGGRFLVGHILTTPAANVSTTPPVVSVPEQVLYPGGGMAYATFSIK